MFETELIWKSSLFFCGFIALKKEKVLLLALHTQLGFVSLFSPLSTSQFFKK